MPDLRFPCEGQDEARRAAGGRTTSDCGAVTAVSQHTFAGDAGREGTRLAPRPTRRGPQASSNGDS